MTTASDLAACDQEPIHRPGSIQPHGLLLLVDPESLTIRHIAGDPDRHLHPADGTPILWQDQKLAAVIGDVMAARAASVGPDGISYLGRICAPNRLSLDATGFRSGCWLVLELEPTPAEPIAGAMLLGILESAGFAFERATSLNDLYARAATEFRVLTGFDRVMVYQFLPQGT